MCNLLRAFCFYFYSRVAKCVNWDFCLVMLFYRVWLPFTKFILVTNRMSLRIIILTKTDSHLLPMFLINILHHLSNFRVINQSTRQETTWSKFKTCRTSKVLGWMFSQPFTYLFKFNVPRIFIPFSFAQIAVVNKATVNLFIPPLVGANRLPFEEGGILPLRHWVGKHFNTRAE